MTLLAMSKPLVGMVHLLPLAGSVGYARQGVAPIADAALRDLDALEKGGVDAVMVENFGDSPFAKTPPRETVAMLAVLVQRLVDRARVPVGVNVLRNDGESAVAIAGATGACFVRVNVFAGVAFTDQGTIEGRARDVLRLRHDLGIEVEVLADVHVKHAVHLTKLEEAVIDVDRNRPDALILSGLGTGFPTDVADLEAARHLTRRPVFVGSGVDVSNVATYRRADGFIVGTSLKEDGRVDRPVDVRRVRAMADVIAALRSAS